VGYVIQARNKHLEAGRDRALQLKRQRSGASFDFLLEMEDGGNMTADDLFPAIAQQALRRRIEIDHRARDIGGNHCRHRTLENRVLDLAQFGQRFSAEPDSDICTAAEWWYFGHESVRNGHAKMLEITISSENRTIRYFACHFLLPEENVEPYRLTRMTDYLSISQSLA